MLLWWVYLRRLRTLTVLKPQGSVKLAILRVVTEFYMTRAVLCYKMWAVLTTGLCNFELAVSLLLFRYCCIEPQLAFA